MPIRLHVLVMIFFALSAGPASAEWRSFAPQAGEPNVHRAFAFAEKGDDRLELACTTQRRDFFYSAAQTVSEQELTRISGGKPTMLIRLQGIGVVPLKADRAYQKGGRLIFVTAVTPAFIKDFGKNTVAFAAGAQAAGQVVRQSVFPAKGLQAALKNLAAGCRF